MKHTQTGSINPPIDSMQDAFSVQGKNVVVTGGSRGIGFGIVSAFAQSGANVAIICRNSAAGSEVAKDLADKWHVRMTCVSADITNIADVRKAETEIFHFFDHVDVLVNNAGIAATGPFLRPEGLDEWGKVLDTDLNGVANVVYCFAPHMIAAGKGGCIINTSSIGGHRVSGSRAHPNPPYHAAKAGVDQFTRYLALELAEAGIRVNAVAPGLFHSDLDELLPQDFKDAVVRECPAHRFGEALEIGAYCVFLASPAGRMVNGAVCVMDGGWTCTR